MEKFVTALSWIVALLPPLAFVAYFTGLVHEAFWMSVVYGALVSWANWTRTKREGCPQ